MKAFILHNTDDTCVHIFRTEMELLGYVEAPEIEEGFYEVYDERGNYYELIVKDNRNQMVMKESLPDQLHDRLKVYLSSCIPSKAVVFENATLETLVEELQRFSDDQAFSLEKVAKNLSASLCAPVLGIVRWWREFLRRTG